MSVFSIDPRAPVTGRAAGFIAAAPGAVWALLSDPGTWPAWYPGVTEAHFEGPLVPGTEFDRFSGPAFVRSRLELVEPGERLGWRDSGIGSGAPHLWTLRPERGGTSVVTEASLSGLSAWLFRASRRQALDTGLNAAIGALARLATVGDRAA